MQKADAGDYGPLGELIARAMYDNLNRFIVPNVASPARLVPLASMADKHLSVAALRQAAQRARLAATHGPDGIWRSSQHAVNEYQRTKKNRRPSNTLRDVALSNPPFGRKSVEFEAVAAALEAAATADHIPAAPCT